MVKPGLVLVAALSLSACQGAEPPAGPRTAELPTLSYRNGEDALISGILRAEEQEDGVCVWIDSGSEAVSVRWPPGYSARLSEPIEIVDGSGVTVAQEGDRVEGGGGYHEDSLGACHRGKPQYAWWAGGLTAID